MRGPDDPGAPPEVPPAVPRAGSSKATTRGGVERRPHPAPAHGAGCSRRLCVTQSRSSSGIVSTEVNSMRKPPLESTIKHLFALSNNRCAFPNCTQPLVDSDGNLVAEMCHIEAAEPGGERYNVGQSDEERRSFENLILLCPNHHVITNDVVKYTVQELRNMKHAHEKNCAAIKYDVPDAVLRKIIDASGPRQIQEGGAHAFNVQGGTVIVNYGMPEEKVHDIAMEIFRDNFLRLRDEAAGIALGRAEKLVDNLLARLGSMEVKLDNLSRDPDFQSTLYIAQREYARSGSEDLERLLIELLSERIKAPERNLIQIVFNECVAVAPKLTNPQLSALSLTFLLSRTQNFSVIDDKSFRQYCDAQLLPFLDDASREHSHFEHLMYCGCGTISIGSIPLERCLGENYPWTRYGGFTREEIATQFGDLRPSKPLFCPSEVDPSKFRLLTGQQADILKYAQEAGLTEAQSMKVWDAQASRMVDVKAGVEALKRCHQRGSEIVSWYEQTPARNLKLTSVGIGLAYAHIRERLKVPLDLSIWIRP